MNFLDTLKAFLTAMVITHHVVCTFQPETATGISFHSARDGQTAFSAFADCFLGLQQAYFMGLFFFITGYFTPSSFDRKGRFEFLRDRFKRIGLPALLYTLFLGPFQIFFIILIGPGLHGPGISPASTPGHLVPSASPGWHYDIYSGQCWYLFWLLLFSVLFACSREPGAQVMKLAAPSLSQLLLLGVVFGAWWALVPWAGSLAMMPGGLNQFVPYVLFFCGGVLAKQNGWLTELVVELPDRMVWFVRVFMTVGVCLYIAGTLDIVLDPGQDTGTVAQVQQKGSLVLGVYAVLVSLVELQFFFKHFNGGGRLAKFFGDNAYAAYIFHYFFINLAVWAYAKMLGDRVATYISGNTVVFYLDDDSTWDTELLVWMGVLWSLVVSQLFVWPFAHLMRQIPGFRQVL